MSDLSDNAIRAYAANIFDLEDAREEAQTDLKGAWSHIREAHGKRFADSLKLAVKRARQDADKRAAADEVDAEAERIMAILASRAPRATRIREIIENELERARRPKRERRRDAASFIAAKKATTEALARVAAKQRGARMQGRVG